MEAKLYSIKPCVLHDTLALCMAQANSKVLYESKIIYISTFYFSSQRYNWKITSKLYLQQYGDLDSGKKQVSVELLMQAKQSGSENRKSKCICMQYSNSWL